MQGGDPVTALVQQTGNGTSTDKGNLASRKETVFRKTFLKGAYAAQAMIRRHDVTETGDTCNLVPGLFLLLSSGIEPLC